VTRSKLETRSTTRPDFKSMILPHEIRSGVDTGTTVKWQIHSAGFLLFIFFQLIELINFYEKKSMYVTVN